MKKYFTLFCLVAIVVTGLGQKNVDFTKANFPNQKPELRKALKEIKYANAYYEENSPGGYKLALMHYVFAQHFNDKNAVVNYRIGYCFFHGSIFQIRAAKFFEEAYKLNRKVDPNIYYMLGRSYHVRGEWDKAIKSYEKHQKTMPVNATPAEQDNIVKKIEECKRGKLYTANPVRVFIDNMNNGTDTINTKYAEYGAVITADESMMIFTSLRKGSTGDKIDPYYNEYFEDIYVSYRNDGHWGKPQNMGKPINSNGHDAISNISQDGSKLLVYLDDGGDGNLYECHLKGDEWSKLKKIHKNVNTEYHESSACYSSDGKTLYFVSSKPGGFGRHDIYMSNWDEKKKRDYCVKTTTRHKMCECGAVSLYLPCRSKDSAGMVAACLTRDGT